MFPSITIIIIVQIIVPLKVESEDDYFRAKREYKKDLKNKVFEDLEKEAKKRKRKRKKVMMMIFVTDFSDHDDLDRECSETMFT